MAQIDAAHFGIRAQLAGRPGAENAAAVQNIGAIGHRQRLWNVMVGEQDADSRSA